MRKKHFSINIYKHQAQKKADDKRLPLIIFSVPYVFAWDRRDRRDSPYVIWLTAVPLLFLAMGQTGQKSENIKSCPVCPVTVFSNGTAQSLAAYSLSRSSRLSQSF